MRILYIDCFSVFDASMLLASLIDAGAKSETKVKETSRLGIECKIADVSANAQTHCLNAIKELNIDYIITSPLGIPSGTDGEVLTVLEKGGIETLPCDSSTKKMKLADAQFLIKISAECGPKPDMNILSVGYGAGGEDENEANIITSYIGEFDGGNLICREENLLGVL